MSWANIVKDFKNIEKKDNEIEKKDNEIEKKDNIEDDNNIVDLYTFKSYDDEFLDIYQNSIINIKEELKKNIAYNAYPFLDKLQLFTQYSLINLISSVFK